jgi:hypothetical protein
MHLMSERKVHRVRCRSRLMKDPREQKHLCISDESKAFLVCRGNRWDVDHDTRFALPQRENLLASSAGRYRQEPCLYGMKLPERARTIVASAELMLPSTL